MLKKGRSTNRRHLCGSNYIIYGNGSAAQNAPMTFMRVDAVSELEGLKLLVALSLCTMPEWRAKSTALDTLGSARCIWLRKQRQCSAAVASEC